MAQLRPEQRILTSFTSEQWSGKPGQDAGNMFIRFAVIGMILGLILIISIPGLRSTGAVTLFAAVFSVVFTTLAVLGKASSERKALDNLTATVNDTLLGLTGNPNDQLSAAQFRSLVETGKHLPLLVNGVPGLDLSVVRDQPPQLREPVVKRVDNVVRTTRVVITVTPPEYGIVSFDRLLSAAVEHDD